MEIKVRPELKILYSHAAFRGLIVKNIANERQDEAIEKLKHGLEKKIRERYLEADKDPVIQSYERYYQQWNKTYPITFQLKTIKEGGEIPHRLNPGRLNVSRRAKKQDLDLGSRSG